MNEEIEKQKKADAEAAAKKAVDDATASVRAELAKAQEELKKLQDKDFNFNKVVKSEKEKEEALTKAQEAIAGLTTKIGELEKKPLVDARDGLIGALAGADEKIKKDLESAYERFGKDAKSPDEVEKAVKDAYLSVTGRAVDNGDISRGLSRVGFGGRRAAPVNSQGNVNPEVKGLAENFNKHIGDPKARITDEDIKKYPVKPGQSAESTIK